MHDYYDVGALVLVYDPYCDREIICVIVGVATAMIYEDEDNFLYNSYCLTYNKPYFFFDVDIVSCLSEKSYREYFF